MRHVAFHRRHECTDTPRYRAPKDQPVSPAAPVTLLHSHYISIVEGEQELPTRFRLHLDHFRWIARINLTFCELFVDRSHFAPTTYPASVTDLLAVVMLSRLSLDYPRKTAKPRTFSSLSLHWRLPSPHHQRRQMLLQLRRFCVKSSRGSNRQSGRRHQA